MRILHVVTNADLGGAPRVVIELANQAFAAGHECAVASVPSGAMWSALAPQVEKKPLRHLRRDIDPINDVLATAELARMFREWRPDIIHLHSSKVGALGRLAAGPRASRVVYTIHGFDTILKSHRVFLPLERVLAKRCGALVPVSSYDRGNLENARVAGNITLIQNGVTDRRNSRPLDPELAARLGDARRSGALVVMTIARLAAPKRFDLFVETARRFKAAEAMFFWIGNAVHPADVDLPGNVVMLGEQPEAGDYLNFCDLFLLLSDYEGMPMSILEALSCGLPIVASKVGGIPEALGEAGDLVANDAKEAADAIRRLAEHPEERRLRGVEARKRYEMSFSSQAMWLAYERLYLSLVDETSASSLRYARIRGQS